MIRRDETKRDGDGVRLIAVDRSDGLELLAAVTGKASDSTILARYRAERFKSSPTKNPATRLLVHPTHLEPRR